MNHARMAVALTPYRTRVARAVRTREILRVAASFGPARPADTVEAAIQEVLIWAQNRSGGQLPAEAWEGESFEHLAGGRTVLALRLEDEGGVLWMLRADDPDKHVPGRVWTTEVAVRTPQTGLPQLSVRQLASSSEIDIRISPHVPGLLKQIAEEHELRSGGLLIQTRPIHIGSDEEAGTLVELLENTDRQIPIVVASGDELAADPAAPLIDVDSVAGATLGLGLVVVVPASYTYALTQAFGKIRSVFYGAVRIYLPGFDESSDPYEHRLFLAESLKRTPAAKQNEIRRLVARESLLRTGRGGVGSFASLRSALARRRQEAANRAPEAEKLEAAEQRTQALAQELKDARNEVEQYVDMVDAAEERAKSAERMQHAFQARLGAFERALAEQGIDPYDGIGCLSEWDQLVNWCDEFLVGRLILAPQARRGIKKAEFQDPGVAAKAIRWLAFEGRDRRIEGGGTIANIPIFPGVDNAPCGTDSFEFEWQGRRMTAHWHVKNGGNTRSPKRCLRIYYCFDEVTQQIVVADMPAHRRSDVS